MNLRKQFKRWLYGSCPGFAGRFPYFGSRIYFPRDAAIFDAVCEQGIFESEIVQRLQALVRPDTYFFDVGANIGLMAVPVLHSCRKCKVVSFEPSPNSLPYLCRTVSESGYAGRWEVVGRALANLPGELDFTVGRPKDALFEGFKSAGRISGARTIRVAVSTLDAEWTNLGRPPVSVVKVDVEGAEGLVLDGGREMYFACRPHLIIEWYADYLQAFGTPSSYLIEFAREHGFEIYSIPQGVPVKDAGTLRVQMMGCSNFLLSPIGLAVVA